LSGNFSPGFPDPKIFALHFTGIIWSFLRDVILVPTRTERKNAQITSKIIRHFRFNRKSADDIFDLTKNFWFKKLLRLFFLDGTLPSSKFFMENLNLKKKNISFSSYLLSSSDGFQFSYN
jgi:predicted Rossmann fold nucleotide-binding protein DprA/Smf involved in DNA uptake